MGQTKTLIDQLIKKRANGDPFLESSTRIKLIMKGIDPKKIDESTPDNPETIAKIHEVAKALNVTL
ncbi:MAG: hypothetical protein ACOC10_00110 [Bacteroidota bacterium]